MKKLFFAIACVVAVFGFGLISHGVASARPHATPTPAPTPNAAPENQRATAIARREFIAWQLGVVNHAHYNADFAALLTPEKVAKTANELSSLGALQNVVWVGYLSDPDIANGQPVYLYHMICAGGAVYAEFGFDTDGKVAGVLFRDVLPTIAPKT